MFGKGKTAPAVLAMAGIIVSLLCDTMTKAAGPGITTAVCDTYMWTFNSLGQSPCLVASYLISACGSEVSLVPAGCQYKAITVNASASVMPCLCTIVIYNLLSACSACQNCTVPTQLSDWSTFLANCSTTDISFTGYPHPIPPGTSVPAWAYLQPNDGYWDAAGAANDNGAPESTPSASFTTVSASVRASFSTTMTSPTTTSAMSTSSAPTSTPTDRSGTNKGAIAGSVVGALVGVAAIAGSIIYIVWRRKRSQRDLTDAAAVRALDSSITIQRVYDPADPSTYPPPMDQLQVAHSRPSSAVRMIVDRVSHPGLPEL